MAQSLTHKILRATLWLIFGIVTLVLIIPVLLYIPPIQDFAKDIALKEVRKSTGMDVSIGYLRLKFPLNVQLHDVTVIEATGDTMATLGTAGINVQFMPLLKGDIAITGTQLKDVRYNLGTPDSAIYLTAYVHTFNADGANLNFSKGNINVDRAALDGAEINLVLKDTITTEKTDTSATKPLLIHAGDITLSNVTYTMSMLPTIDSLSTHIPTARLIDGSVDMSTNSIHAQMLKVDSISATYLTPSAEFLAEYPTADSIKSTSTSESAPWTITADSLRLTANNAIYAMRGASPLPGLDLNYLQVRDVEIAVDSFYNRATSITVPLRTLRATERCGVELHAKGTFAMDSTTMQAKGFDVSTLFSKLHIDASMGMGNLATDPELPLILMANGNIGLTDIEQLMPTTRTTLRDVPRSNGLLIDADIQGTASMLNVNNVQLTLPHYIKLQAHGSVTSPMDAKKIGGKVSLYGKLTNAGFIKNIALDAATAKQVNIPNMTLKGDIRYSPAGASGTIAALTNEGKLAFDGKWQQRTQGYNANLTLNTFPIQAFMPSLGIGDLTATVKVDGHGYNPVAPTTVINADALISEMDYNKKRIVNSNVQATLANGEVKGYLDTHNPEADLSVNFSGNLTKDLYSWNVDGDVRHLDLQALGLSETPLYGSMTIDTKGSFAPAGMGIDADVTINHLNWMMDDRRITTDEINLAMLTGDSTTHATLKTGDLNATFTSYMRLDSTLTRMSSLTTVIDSAITHRNINVRALQQALPPMNASILMGQNNIVGSFLASNNISWRNASLSLHNDSLISMHAKTLGLSTSSLRTDTITIDALQHGKFLVYTMGMNNRPGTFDNFAHVNLRGYVANDKASFIVRQRNIQNKEGFFIGLTASMTDSVAKVSFVPHKPVIGYKQWALNKDNFVSYNLFTHQLDANLILDNANSSLHLFTEQKNDSTSLNTQNDVVLQLNNILIQDWLTISPFAPPIKGTVGADMRFNWNSRELTGNGMVNLKDLYYGRDRVGNFDVDLSLFNDKSGLLRADASLMIDSIKVITARGVLNDSTATSPFLLDFSMIHFPLRIVNPFLPKGTAQLSGMLNGQMDITGTMASPIFNGYLDFDSTAVKLAMTGASYKFSEEKIPVDSSVVHFNKFTIAGLNNNPLFINGTVDARTLSNPQIKLNLKANDMQLVNSNRPKGADIYGKAFIDLDADVTGNMSLLRINADLNLIQGTNVTYVVTTAGQTALASK
ncbi:MAG: translocation/assembly module TamB domain-containing protein, partial [Paramuribaculum sp.]|nr:translocation/assembly module TamB domain-containing protein [Paramuribaculum sp.]